MKSLILLASGALLLAASAAGAQSMPSRHSQHHAGKHAAGTSDRHCCCGHEMHEMMGMMHQMMKMHGGMKTSEQGAMKMPMQDQTPQAERAHPN